MSQLNVDTIKNKAGTAGPTLSGDVTITGSINTSGIITASSFSGNGSGLTGVAATTLTIGAGTTALPSISPTGDSNTGIFFPSADTIAVSTGGSERLRVASAGQIGLSGANYGTSGQVLTSAGTGAAPTWKTGGKVLQVVRSHVAGKATTTSTSLTKLATSSSITPSSSGSKIKVTISTGIGNADNGNANFSIIRTVATVDTGVFSDVANKLASGSYQYDAFAFTDLDSPSTTSAVTYSISGVRVDGNATPFVGGRNTDSFYSMGVMFILEEIAS